MCTPCKTYTHAISNNYFKMIIQITTCNYYKIIEKNAYRIIKITFLYFVNNMLKKKIVTNKI